MSKYRILVVDDEPVITFSITAFLRRQAPDCEVNRVFDRASAMEAIRTTHPHVVLLDIDLNGINSGLDILDFLNKEHKGVKTIVITGKAKSHRDHIEKMGCFYFMEKPADLHLLNSKIKDALGVEKIIEDRDLDPHKENPKAKLLFFEPNLRAFAYLASIFDAKEMLNGAEYELKIVQNLGDALDTLSRYQPDIVLIGDYFMDSDQLLDLVKLIKDDIKIKPKSVIVHGLFERDDIFEYKLKQMGVKHCIQNVMDQDEMISMNRKLADTVAQECINQGLIK